MYGRTGISETRLMVAVWMEDDPVTIDGIAGDELVGLRSVGVFVECRAGVAFVSTSRGTSRVLSVLSRNMREPRSRALPRVRE